ncbi:uncharacterized protein LOC117255173 isoform X2 [Epinephelus lanceolatus]
MTEWKLQFLLFLPLCLCFDSEETVVKTIRREPDVTLLCSNATLSTITLIVCRISTEMSRGEECRLLYRFGGDFVHECDSRFTLTEENHTVFLHLTNLTPVDSGDYTCECSHAHGTDKIHLSVTVEGEEEGSTSITIYTAVICCAAGLITVTGVVLGLTLRKCYCRYNSRSGSSVCETPVSVDKDERDDPYTSLEQSGSGLYETMSPVHHQHDKKRTSASSKIVTLHLEQEIYENM